MSAQLFGLFLSSFWSKQILHFMFFFFSYMEQTAAGSCRVKVWARHSFISVSPVKKSFIRTLNPCCKPLWIWTREKRFRCKKAQTKRLQYLCLQQICILIKKKKTSWYVGGTGKHPALWTVCQLHVKQHILREEARRRDSSQMWHWDQRERDKGGKTDCVFKCIASGEASVTTRESVSSCAAALQPSLLCIISSSLCFGQLGAEKQPEGSPRKL